MSKFSEALDSARFLVTAEVAPPKGVDLTKPIEDARTLKGLADGINVTDQQASIMRMAPWALCHHLKEVGLDPIMQMTCRDRNRIALQSDLLGAHALGIENVLCLSGDPTGTGDHPNAKPVFDLDVVSLLQAAQGLQDGHDIAGNKLQGNPKFCVGAVATPGAKPLETEISKLERKVAAGARFVQTQGVFDIDEFAAFAEKAKHIKVHILAGIIVLKSGNQARTMTKNIPGVHVPDQMIGELDNAQDKTAKGIEIAARTIKQLKSRGLCRGVHIMAIGWERHIPAILEEAGLAAKGRRL